MRQLSLLTRPRSLDKLVGQQKVVKAIRQHMAGERVVTAWLFAGPKGVGKTSIARIMSVAYQCDHQTKWGRPCKACYRNRESFGIIEINASDVTGIDRLRALLEGAQYDVLGEGHYRVYILDEVQKLSESAQNLLLKYLEDSHEKVVYILCSTAPQKIAEPLRSRCVSYVLKELEPDDVLGLVERYLETANSQLPADRLTDALNELQVRSPRLVAQAVEKYCAGCSPEEAALVDGATSVDVKAVGRAVVKGDWPTVADYLRKSQTVDHKAIRLSMIAYLRTILLESVEISGNTKAVAKAIDSMCVLVNAEDLVISAGLASALYHVTSFFAQYRH